MKPHTIKMMDLKKLKPAAYNPRTIAPETLTALERSLTEFGLVEPIVWNQRTGHVIGGHQRLKALQKAGETQAQVVIVDLDAKREKTLNLALNKISGEWDYTALAEQFKILEKVQADLTLTGFTDKEYQALIQYGQEVSDQFGNALGLSPEEKKKIYDTNTIKQIVLYYPAARYADILDAFRAIMETHHLSSHTDVVDYLLTFYADHSRETTAH